MKDQKDISGNGEEIPNDIDQPRTQEWGSDTLPGVQSRFSGTNPMLELLDEGLLPHWWEN